MGLGDVANPEANHVEGRGEQSDSACRRHQGFPRDTGPVGRGQCQGEEDYGAPVQASVGKAKKRNEPIGDDSSADAEEKVQGSDGD